MSQDGPAPAESSNDEEGTPGTGEAGLCRSFRRWYSFDIVWTNSLGAQSLLMTQCAPHLQREATAFKVEHGPYCWCRLLRGVGVGEGLCGVVWWREKIRPGKLLNDCSNGSKNAQRISRVLCFLIDCGLLHRQGLFRSSHAAVNSALTHKPLGSAPMSEPPAPQYQSNHNTEAWHFLQLAEVPSSIPYSLGSAPYVKNASRVQKNRLVV